MDLNTENVKLLKKALKLLNDIEFENRSSAIIEVRKYITLVHDRLNGMFPSKNKVEHSNRLLNKLTEREVKE